MPQTFNLGGLEVHYYGLILGLAILVAYFHARSNSWRFGLSKDEVDRFALRLIIVSFISARIYFVLSSLSFFSENPGDIYKVWNGGLSIFGAIIGGLLFCFLYARKKIYSVWQLLDLIALALPLGQVIGRFGNFINYEAFGRPTDLPWRMFIPENFRPAGFSNFEYFHPTFLYEAMAMALLFIFLNLLKGKLRSGNLALTYVLSYAAVRFLIEPLRLDSTFISGFRLDQAMALAVFLVGICVLLARQSSIKKS